MLQSAMPDPEEEARQRMRALGAKKVVQQLGGLRLEAGWFTVLTYLTYSAQQFAKLKKKIKKDAEPGDSPVGDPDEQVRVK